MIQSKVLSKSKCAKPNQFCFVLENSLMNGTKTCVCLHVSSERAFLHVSALSTFDCSNDCVCHCFGGKLLGLCGERELDDEFDLREKDLLCGVGVGGHGSTSFHCCTP